MSNDVEGRLRITKIEAARRQLNAAITMFFRDDDELAVHVVAQSAYQIIRDLLAARGKDAMEAMLSFGFFCMLKAHADGQLGWPHLTQAHYRTWRYCFIRAQATSNLVWPQPQKYSHIMRTIHPFRRCPLASRGSSWRPSNVLGR